MSGTDIEVPRTMDANSPPADLEPAEGIRHPRDDVMARIAANAEAARERELAQAAIYDSDAREAGLTYPPDEPEEPRQETPGPVRQESAPAAEAQKPALVATPSAQPRTVVIDGQNYTVTPEQEEQLLRMGMAANTALHQYQTQPAAPVAREPERPIVDADAIRETVKKIQYAGEDDAAAALTGLISDLVSRIPQGPAIDQNAIVSRAVQESRAQAQLAQDSATIRQEYEDIFAHPQREFLAKVNVDAIRARDTALGQHRPDLEIYREAGNMVREAMGLPRPGNSGPHDPALQATQGNVVPIRNDVIERKRAAPRPTQAIDLRASGPAAPRAPTNAEIVEQMRKARGQASMR